MKSTEDNNQFKNYVLDTKLLEDTTTKQSLGSSLSSCWTKFFSLSDGHLLTFSTFKSQNQLLGFLWRLDDLFSLYLGAIFSVRLSRPLWFFLFLLALFFISLSQYSASFARLPGCTVSSFSLFCTCNFWKLSSPCFNNCCQRLLFSSS